MKRLLPFSFVLVMALCLFNIPANATDSNSEIPDIQASVESFLRNYTEETMLYEDNDLTSHNTPKLNIIADVSVGSSRPRGDANKILDPRDMQTLF